MRARIAVVAVAVAYPLLVYAGLVLLAPRMLAASAAVLLLAQGVWRWRRWRGSGVARAAVPIVLVTVVLVGTSVLDDGRLFLFVPALVNGAMLLAFARTLLRGPSMIETFARLRRPDLPASRAPYLRAVTEVWCVFLAVNITISVLLALYSTLAAWTLYNGIVAYGLAGGLLAAERVYRAWRFRAVHEDRLGLLFRRVFPPAAGGGP